MKTIRIIVMVAAAFLAAQSCTVEHEVTVEYLEVNANNISGKWELVEWNGSPLAD